MIQWLAAGVGFPECLGLVVIPMGCRQNEMDVGEAVHRSNGVRRLHR
ncbi:hypothetical protein Pan44_40970 [Caulifigura coniformis]|uniref:Uncharacterized protein n=1 Tax=Caulifigura coniformis TaxID=2527983 RepID=A0A517SIU9_9PLAN|nr:hypothetical protein Pan44_40970 [Caulifigura coniformis]